MTNPPKDRIGYYTFLAIVWLFFGTLTGCGPKGEAKAALAARESVRAAIHGMAWGVQLATKACAEVVVELDKAGDPRADKVFDTCSKAWDVAKDSLNAAERVVDVWDEGAAGRVVCLAKKAAVALDEVLAVLDSFGLKIPADIQAPIDDALKLGRFLIGIAPGSASCALPVKPAPAPAPSASAGASF